jgi:hypothetical protein
MFLVATSGAVCADENKSWKALEITEVFVDFDPNPDLAFIYGKNFDKGGDPVVLLGDYPDPLFVVQYSEHEIIAELPVDLVAGSYLLTIQTGNARRMSGAFDLTVGAVGRQGEPGLQGEPGPQGVQGPPGFPDFEFVFEQFGRIVVVNDTMIVNPTCPAGKSAISGAFVLSPNPSPPYGFDGYDKFLLRVNQRNTESAWQFAWLNMDTVPHYFGGVARVGCATVQ